MKKKYAIITASDSKYGDFLVNNWYKSLLNHVNLKLVEIVILDYGLTSEQKNKLSLAKLISCKKDGHVTSLRYRDMSKFLEKNKYKWILSVDGGDIIFQDTIMPLFEEHLNKIGVVSEGLIAPNHEFVFISQPFSEDVSENILNELKNKKMLNGGVVIAPYKKFIQLCRFIIKNTKNPKFFGPDQVLLNYYLLYCYI